MSFLRGHTTFEALLLALLDALCLLAAFGLAVWLWLPAGAAFGEELTRLKPHYVLVVVLWWLEAMGERLFVSRRSDALVPQLFSVVRAIFFALILSMFVMAHIGPWGLERRFLLPFALLSILVLLLWRLMVRLSLWGLRRRGYNFRRILIVGANERTAHLAEVILSHEQYGYHVEGFLEDDKTRQHYMKQSGTPYLGEIRNLEHLLVERVIDVVYISLPVRSHYETIRRIAHLCEGVGVQVRLIADLFPLRVATSKAARLGDIPLLSLSAQSELDTSFAIKRLTEVAVSTILLILLMPLLAAIAIIVKLESRGPVLVRIPCCSPGNKKPFGLLKFRTRPVDAKGGPAGLTGTGRLGGDAGRTRVGQHLHRYSLDELPQLMNVWLGQISFTEPRPQPVQDMEPREIPH